VCARARARKRERDRGFKLFRKLPEERRLAAKLRDNSRRALIDLVIVDARGRVYALLHNTRERLIRCISATVTSRSARTRARAPDRVAESLIILLNCNETTWNVCTAGVGSTGTFVSPIFPPPTETPNESAVVNT